jgi:hypothetical protein
MPALRAARVRTARQFDKAFRAFAFVAPPLIVC